MSVTITTGVVLGLGAVGAVGLGVLGIAALKGKRHRRHRRRHRGRRYRRQLHAADTQYNMTAIKDSSPKKLKKNRLEKKWEQQLRRDEEALLSAIQASDESGCGFRLVCELAARDLDSLTEEEWEVLRFVHAGDRDVKQGTGIGPDSPALEAYQAASRLGSSGYACREVFSRCHASAAQIMEAVKSLL